jgi:hypothetical protein
VTFVFVVLGATALANYHFDSAAVVFALLAFIPIVIAHRMRVSADSDGVMVVNLLAPQRVSWDEISDFRMGRVALSTCLDICRRDGTFVRAWVVTTTGASALPRSQVDEILRDLRDQLANVTGVSSRERDASAVQEALAAADRGRYEQASSLVAEGRIDAEEMAQKLIERRRAAQPGETDQAS